MPTSTRAKKCPRTEQRGVSERERHRRAEQSRQAHLPRPGALLYARATTASLLNVSIATVLRMEKRGLLEVVVLNADTPRNAKKFHHAHQVEALANRAA
jgi:hypothetical protein